MKRSDVELDQLKSAADLETSETKPSRKQGQAICMSGGGYRAAIFHLGALLRLHECGLLDDTMLFSSVSGGSIVQGWLVSRYLAGRSGSEGFASWSRRIAFSQEMVEPFRQVTKKDIRSWAIVSTLPFNWLFPNVRMRKLQMRYERAFAGPSTMGDLPDTPSFVFCATDTTFGVNWEFSKLRVGDWLAGYLGDHHSISLAQAIAASSAFPPLFGPMRFREGQRYTKGKYGGADRDTLLAQIGLTDGGVYDNLATEPALKHYSAVLISDAGAPFAFTTSSGWRRLLRYTQIIGNQAISLRKRMFFSARNRREITGAYWGIDNFARTPADGYSAELVSEVVGRIRTDLDAFSNAEFEVLVNHGYLTCNNALEYLNATPTLRVRQPVWPYPAWQKEGLVRKALADSHKRIWHTRWPFLAMFKKITA